VATEQLLEKPSNLLKIQKSSRCFFVVSEAGASIYSASKFERRISNVDIYRSGINFYWKKAARSFG
jgi:hypothetical protein